MKLNIEHRDPVSLKGHIHPTLKSIPELSQESEEFIAMAAGVGRLGITEPLKVDAEGRILEDHSRTMLQCALRWQLTSVPVTVIPEPNVPLIIISGLAHRRHLTKAAIAYLATPLMHQAFTIAREKRLKNLANLDSALSALSSTKVPASTVDDLAEEMGICRRTLFDARKVHELFADKKVYSFNVQGGAQDGTVRECTLKDWFEPRILRAPIGGEHEQNRPLGLGSVKAGIASVREGNKEAFNPKSASQLELFDSGLNAFVGRAFKLPADKMRKQIAAWLDSNAGKFSDEQLDQLEALGETIKSEVKNQRK